MAYKLPQNEFLNTFVQPTRDDAIPATRSVASLMLASLPGFDVEMPGFDPPRFAAIRAELDALSELDPVTMRLRRRYGARRGD